MGQACPAVAQISNLLYRRIPFGKPPDRSEAQEFSQASGLEIRDTAGWKPALRGFSPGKTEALRGEQLPHCFEPLLPLPPASRRTTQASRLCYPQTVFQTRS